MAGSLAFNISVDTDQVITDFTRINKKADTLIGKVKRVNNMFAANQKQLAGFITEGVSFSSKEPIQSQGKLNQVTKSIKKIVKRLPDVLDLELKNAANTIKSMISIVKMGKIKFLRKEINNLTASTKKAKQVMDEFTLSITNTQQETKVFRKKLAKVTEIVSRKASTQLTSRRDEAKSLGKADSSKLVGSSAPIKKIAGNKLANVKGWISSLPGPIKKTIVFSSALLAKLFGVAVNVGKLIGSLKNFGNLFTSGGSVYKGVSWFIKTAIPWLTGTSLPVLKAQIKVVGSALLSFGSTIIQTVIPAIASFIATLATNPLTWMVLGVVALTYGLYQLATNWELVKEKTVAFVNFAGQKLKAFFNWFKGILQKTPNWIQCFIAPWSLVIEHWDKIQSKFKSGFSWLQSTFNKLKKWVINLWPQEGIFGFLIPDNFNLGNRLGSLIQGTVNALPGWLQGPAKKIISFIGGGYNSQSARKVDQQAVQNTQRTISNNRITKQKNEVKIEVKESDNPRKTGREIRKHIESIFAERAAAAGVK